MSKANPPSKKKSKARLDLAALAPEVAQAVLEDAVMEAAADLAAIAATTGATGANGSAPILEAVTPEEEALLELLGVPFLGPTRARALAGAGIRTVADLHAATPSQIGGVKGVGMRNAERIKEWLASQPAPSPSGDRPPAPANLPPASLDPATASANQRVQDALGRLDQAVAEIKAALPRKAGDKKLERQLDQVLIVASELPESFDTLRPKPLQRACKTLEKLADLLAEAACHGRASRKERNALRGALRDKRKRLEKALGL